MTELEKFDKKYWPWAMMAMGFMLGSLIGLVYGAFGDWYKPGHSHEINGFVYVYPDSKGVITIPSNSVDGKATLTIPGKDCYYVQGEKGGNGGGGSGGGGLACGEGSIVVPGKGGDSR